VAEFHVVLGDTNGLVAGGRAAVLHDAGWRRPRQTGAETIEQAVPLADRYQRSFLRLVEVIQDNRRLFASLVVAGGQVNIGEQKITIEQPIRAKNADGP
jgi:hypothetical protein